MLLAIDAGNTNIVFAVFDDNMLRGEWRIATDSRRTADEYGVWLTRLMELAHIDTKAITHAIVSSVVPQALFELRMLCRNYFSVEMKAVGEPGVRIGVTACIDNPAEVGADRLVNAYAAWNEHHCPLIVVDFGTATTFDVVNDKGEYRGGVIAPGVNLSLDALQKAAAKLPNVGIVRPAAVVGTNTVSAMQSGIYYGYVGLIEGIVSRIRQEYGAPMKVVATGGLASLYAKSCNVFDHIEPDLTLNGLRLIHQLNSQ